MQKCIQFVQVAPSCNFSANGYPLEFMITYISYLRVSVVSRHHYTSSFSLMSSAASLCFVSNLGWIFISCLALLGSHTDSQEDVLFYYRYLLSLVSSVVSVLAIKFVRKRRLGQISVFLFVPFIFLQLAEAYVVYKCGQNPDLEKYWGVACSSLLVFREETKLIQVLTDEFAVLVLGIANLIILWRCHITFGFILYRSESKVGATQRQALRKPLLSENVSDGSGGFTSFISFQSASDQYVSAEEGESHTTFNASSSSPLMVLHVTVFSCCIS